MSPADRTLTNGMWKLPPPAIATSPPREPVGGYVTASAQAATAAATGPSTRRK